MAPFPDEVDVFTTPHGRMKHLVQLYCDELSKTNFSNDRDFQLLLQLLHSTFKEFKTHEQIENECILAKLRSRLQAMSVTNSLVYKAHSDNKLSEMLNLFENGLRNAKNEYERVNYGNQLKEELEAFTQGFIPHMKEEEEVFQPLLMEYFTYDELKDIKSRVIAQHCSLGAQDSGSRPVGLKGNSIMQQPGKLELDGKGEEKEARSSPVLDLPTDVMLHVFGFLGVRDLCRCAQVCLTWAQLAMDGSLWKHLYPVRWSQGDLYNGPPGGIVDGILEEEMSGDKMRAEGADVPYTFHDEDADVDESGEDLNEATSLALKQEKQCLRSILQNILPVAGPFVKSVILANSKAATNTMVQRILTLCPNLEYLDLTQTRIGDTAFKSLGAGATLWNLKHLDLSGCDLIGDCALRYLSQGLGFSASCANILANLGPYGKQKTPFSSQSIMDMTCGRPCAALCTAMLCTPAAPILAFCTGEHLDIEEVALCRSLLAHGHPPGLKSDNLRCFLEAAADCCAPGDCIHTLCRARTWICEHSSIHNRCLCKGSASRTVPMGRLLEFLSLSGCYRLTDEGLRCLVLRGGLPNIHHLDLSGCRFVTGDGLQDLVAVCPSLNPDHFYYCDYISGPHSALASGCQNLQCGSRACCCSGE
uniref:F-box/LRR-repeat protein 5 n=1 Tax=Myxine glutinosa TaxID=7769 RepID=UPI00358EA402